MAFVTHLTFVNISIIIQILSCVKSIYDIVSIYFWYVESEISKRPCRYHLFYGGEFYSAQRSGCLSRNGVKNRGYFAPRLKKTIERKAVV